LMGTPQKATDLETWARKSMGEESGFQHFNFYLYLKIISSTKLQKKASH
jgi:hypothetical protein